MMNLRGRTLALVLAAAVVLASGAYALGSQVGGGSATAAKDEQNRPTRDVMFRGGPPPGLDNLADKLGVSEDKLEGALEELRDELAPKGKDRVEKRLGKGPGIGFGIIGPGGDLAKELATELGVDEAKVEQALENIQKKREAEAKSKRDEFAQKLADKLGISVDKVKEAFADGPGFGGPPPFGRHP